MSQCILEQRECKSTEQHVLVGVRRLARFASTENLGVKIRDTDAADIVEVAGSIRAGLWLDDPVSLGVDGRGGDVDGVAVVRV